MSYRAEKVTFFSSGSGNIRERFPKNPWKIIEGAESQAILLSLAEGPRPLTDIQRALGRDKAIIKKQLKALCEAKMITEREGKWQPSFVILTDKAAEFLASSLEPVVDKIATNLSASIRELKHTYEQTEVASNYAWDDFAHIYVDALILDFGMLGCVDFTSLGYGFYDLWSEEQCQVSFFGLEVGPHQVILGVNSYRFDNYGISVMHSTLFSRILYMHQLNNILRNEAVREFLTRCLSNKGEVPEIAVPRILSQTGWISETGNKPKLSIPFLNDSDKETLTTIGLEVGHKAAEIVARNLEIIIQSFDKLDFGNWIEGIGDFATIALHIPLALVPVKLARKGLLPKIPQEAPMTWGVWAWTGPWTLDFRVLAEHRLKDAETAISQLPPKEQRKKEEHLLRARSLFEDNKPTEALQALHPILLPSHA